MPNLQDDELRAPLLMFPLIDRVSDHDSVQRTGIDSLDCVAAEHAMRDQGVHFRGTLLFEEFGRPRDGIGGVGEIVDEDGGSAGHFADEHHCCVLAVGDLGGTTFLDIRLLVRVKPRTPVIGGGGVPCGSGQIQSRGNLQ